MIAIRTRYHGATNTRGSRISATDGRHRVTISYPHSLSGLSCHGVAAEKLCAKMGWKGKLVGGWHGQDGYWCFLGSTHANDPGICPSCHGTGEPCTECGRSGRPNDC